jgi:hypothetical protein
MPRHASFMRDAVSPRRIGAAQLHLQSLRSRRRAHHSAAASLRLLERMLHTAACELGQTWACDLFLRAEIDEWARKCEAGAQLRRRQAALGFGFCNVRALVYETMRETLPLCLRLLTQLGFVHEQAWTDAPGRRAVHALRQPELRVRVLLDVDHAVGDPAAPADTPLSPLPEFGGAGLWCALMGDGLAASGPSLAVIDAAPDRLDQLLTQACHPSLIRVDPSASAYVARGSDIAIAPSRISALLREGHLPNAYAEQLKRNGTPAAHLITMAQRIASGAELTMLANVLSALIPKQDFAPAPLGRRRRSRRRPSRVRAPAPAGVVFG